MVLPRDEGEELSSYDILKERKRWCTWSMELALSSTLCLFSFAGTACSADKSGNVNDNFRDPENGTSMTASVSRACSTRSLQ